MKVPSRAKIALMARFVALSPTHSFHRIDGRFRNFDRAVNVSLMGSAHACAMKRIMFLAAFVFLLFGVDLVANDAAMTHDIMRAFASAGRRAARAIEATVASITGRG